MRKTRTRVWSVLLTCAMLLTLLPTAALAAELKALPDVSDDGVITLVEDITLTEDVTLTNGQVLNAGDYTINGGDYKITLQSGAIVTSAVDNDLYDVLKGDSKYFVSYTDNGGNRTYICSDITSDSSGYGVFMAGHPAIIEQYGDDAENLLITYTDDDVTYSLRYQNEKGCAAVVYGGVKDQIVDGLNTSLTLRSGTVAALVAGSKVPSYNSSGEHIGDNGSVDTAVINIEGGSVVGDSLCSGQPYQSQGMVMGIWYTGPDIGTFTFNMTGGSITGQVYGGAGSSSYSNANYEGMTVDKFVANISGGTIAGDVFAGGNDQNTAENSTQAVNSAVIEVSGDATVTNIYGGGFANWNGAHSAVGDVKIHIQGGTVGNIFGGGQNGTASAYNNSAVSEVTSASITIDGGTVANVYGGGRNYHWVNHYWVDDDGDVIKMNYNNTEEAPDIHYSNVENSTITINGGSILSEVVLGGSSWAHVGTSTAYINTDVASVSCLGGYGYVENSNVVVGEGATVENLDLVRSGIVENVTITNNGTIDTLIAGAPENCYVDNMGVNVVGVLGDVQITNNGTVGEAQLTYGLEYADKVTSDVPLTITGVSKGSEYTGEDKTSNTFQPQVNSDWSGTTVILNSGTTFTNADNATPPTVQFADGTIAEETEGSYSGKTAKVGDTYYDSLSDAMTAAKEGDDKTVLLVGDAALSCAVPEGVTVQVLKGITLTVDLTENSGAVLTSQGTVQVEAGGEVKVGDDTLIGRSDATINLTAGSVAVHMESGRLNLAFTGAEAEVPAGHRWTLVLGSGAAQVNMDVTLDADTTLTVNSTGVAGGEADGLRVANGSTLTNDGEIVVNGVMTVSSTGEVSGSGTITIHSDGVLEVNTNNTATGKLGNHVANSGTVVYNGAANTDNVTGTITLSSSGKVYSQADISDKLSDAEGMSNKNYEGTDYAYAWQYDAPSSSGSGGSGSYAITVEKAENGAVKVSPTRASSGRTVTITVTPDEGYKLDKLTVTDKSGDEIELTKVSDTRYTFTMPRGAVEITAAFAEEEVVSTLPFTDVDLDDWFYDAVEYAYDNGMMNGIGNSLFAPTSSLNRAMMAQVLWNLEGSPAASSTTAYSDVASDVWYYDAVQWATAEGIVGGYGDGIYGPEDNITREQMALMLYRYAQYKGYDATQGGMEVREFTDYEEISDWALEGMTWAVNAGLLSGKGSGVLDPAGNATRAEVAQILMNFCENIVK